MRRNGQNTTSGIKSDHAIRSGMPENLYVWEIVAENAILKALLPVSDLTAPFDPGKVENLYCQEILAKNAICRHFSRMSNFCPIACPGDFLCMFVKPEVVVRIYSPRDPVLTVLVPCKIW